mgnify:CR=1 FL=1
MEDSKLEPSVPEDINPFSAAERIAKQSGAARKYVILVDYQPHLVFGNTIDFLFWMTRWEQPTASELARRKALANQRARTAQLMYVKGKAGLSMFHF